MRQNYTILKHDSLADSLEDQIYIVAYNIHKHIQTIPSRYYKRHRLIVDALMTILHILKETIYFLQITPDQAYTNYQESLTLQEVHYLFQMIMNLK